MLASGATFLARGSSQALNKIREWDYNKEAPIALGTFYKKEAPTFEENFLPHKGKLIDRDSKIKELLKDLT